MGIDHAYTPPREPSLNEAEKVCNHMWAAARAHLAISKAPMTLMAECVSYCMHVDLRIATTANKDWKTPYEIIKGVQPSLLKLQRWYTKAFVNIPNTSRSAMQSKGVLDRAELGRLIGYHSPFSNVAAVMLSKNRLVHSSNVTYDPSDCIHLTPAEVAAAERADVRIPGVSPGSNAGTVDNPAAPAAATDDSDTTTVENLPSYPRVNIEHCDLFRQFKVDEPGAAAEQEYVEWTPGRDGDWLTRADAPVAKPRPSYKGMMARENYLNQWRIIVSIIMTAAILPYWSPVMYPVLEMLTMKGCTSAACTLR
jgi:hypothetical protein